MRELRYRVYDKTCGYYVAVLGNDCFGLKQVARIIFELEHLKHEYIIEPCTGLKDKNGKEICEGDIVEYTTRYYGNEKRHRKVVEWEEWDSDDFGVPHNIGYSNLNEYMAVVGNINENPELLESKNVD